MVQRQMVNPEDIHTNNIRIRQDLFGNINVYISTHLHVILIDEKGSHKLKGEREPGGVYGRVYSEETEGKNVIKI